MVPESDKNHNPGNAMVPEMRIVRMTWQPNPEIALFLHLAATIPILIIV
jgi:hypothetical protein